jgi:hypothetical protein
LKAILNKHHSLVINVNSAVHQYLHNLHLNLSHSASATSP